MTTPASTFDPDERELPPDAMEQEPAVQELLGLLASRCTDFGQRPDTFLSSNTILCYDPADLNVRVAPDVYLAFGVDTQAIRQRRLYLPWEAGKPPDLAVEVASASTARQDVTAKRQIYARIGVREYWRFDPTGGKYHGQPLAGERLFEGAYRPIALTREPDGVLKGYSAVLGLYLCWARELPRLYDPETETYLENWPEVAAAREAAEAERDAAETQAAVEQAARLAERTARRAAETRAAAERTRRINVVPLRPSWSGSEHNYVAGQRIDNLAPRPRPPPRTVRPRIPALARANPARPRSR